MSLFKWGRNWLLLHPCVGQELAFTTSFAQEQLSGASALQSNIAIGGIAVDSYWCHMFLRKEKNSLRR